MEVQKKIDSAAKELELVAAREFAAQVARDLGRHQDFNFNNADHIELDEIAGLLANTSDMDRPGFGPFNVKALREKLGSTQVNVDRINPNVRSEAIRLSEACKATA